MGARYHFIKTDNVSSSHSHKQHFYQELTENVLIKKIRMRERSGVEIY